MSVVDTTYTEKADLDSSIAKLTEFMHTDDYAQLAATDQGLLMVQHAAMISYSDVLGRRLETF